MCMSNCIIMKQLLPLCFLIINFSISTICLSEQTTEGPKGTEPIENELVNEQKGFIEIHIEQNITQITEQNGTGNTAIHSGNPLMDTPFQLIDWLNPASGLLNGYKPVSANVRPNVHKPEYGSYPPDYPGGMPEPNKFNRQPASTQVHINIGGIPTLKPMKPLPIIRTLKPLFTKTTLRPQHGSDYYDQDFNEQDYHQQNGYEQGVSHQDGYDQDGYDYRGEPRDPLNKLPHE